MSALKRIRRVASLILFNLLSLVVALVVAEWVVRATWTPPSMLSTPVTEAHPVYGWEPIPGLHGRSVTMEYDYEFHNSTQGMRGTQVFTRQRPPEISHRILFLGDSFTYGIGSADEEIFVRRLAKTLPGTEVINTGTNGYGQRQQLAVQTTLGRAVQPDMTVLMFFWNDVEDNINPNAPDFALDDTGAVVRTDKIIDPGFDPLAERHPTRIYRPGAENYVPPDKPWRKYWLFKLFKEGAKGARHRWFGQRPRDIQTEDEARAAWLETRRLLQLMATEAAAQGSQFVVVSIPDYERVDPSKPVKGQLPVNINIEGRLATLCRELSINYIDLLPDMQAAQAQTDEALYYMTDRHLTPAGNAVVAELLLTRLGLQ